MYTPKYNSWGLNVREYWKLFIVEYLQPYNLETGHMEVS